jgi:hypothetical protein
MMFGAAAIAAALTGQGYRVLLVLLAMFLPCFNVAFSRQATLLEIIATFRQTASSKDIYAAKPSGDEATGRLPVGRTKRSESSL